MKSTLMITAAATLAGALAFAGAASAAQNAECPADQMRADARTTGEMTPSKVTDTELNALMLGGEIKGLDGRRLRLRKLVIQPGGVVPWHSHTDRPAIIFVQQGEIYEYASNCAVPILHKEGDVRPEVKGTSHWWENKGTRTVILYVGDILHDKSDHHM